MVIVKDVLYKINGLGKLIAILEVTQNEEMIKHGIKHISLDSIDTLKKGKLGVNATMVIEVKDQDGMAIPIVNEIVTTSEEYGKIPIICPSCFNILATEYQCTNYYCGGTSRGCLYRFMQQAGNFLFPEAPTIITKFLNGFALSIGSTTILNLGEFQIISNSIVVKNTATRLKQWIGVHGQEDGELCFQLEQDIEKYLHKNTLTREEFWDIVNLPAIPECHLHRITKLYPNALIKGYTKQFSTLSKRAKLSVMNNFDFIQFVYNFLNKKQKKTWK